MGEEGLLSAQPSNAGPQNVGGYAAFYEAVKCGDLPNARKAMRTARDEGTVISNLSVCTLVLGSKFFAQICPLMDDALKTNAPAILGDDSVFYRMRPEHIRWLDTTGYLSASFAPRYLILASQRGDGQMVKALLGTRTGKKFSEDVKQHALCAATGARCLDCIEELLQCGANPYLGMKFISNQSQATPPVDIAAKSYWIEGLKRMDRNQKYKEFVANFEKEFPTTGTSPFIGTWDNQRDGFYTSTICFNPDATGTFNGGFLSAPIVWKISNQGVTIFPIFENGIEREKTVELSFISQNSELILKREHGAAEHYRKVAISP